MYVSIGTMTEYN